MVLTSQLKYVKYFLIVILAVGLYFTQLKAKITNLPQDFKSPEEESIEQSKTIKILLPDIKIDYKDINLKLSDEDTNKKDDIIFTSNITFDEDKKVERIGIQLKTKF